LTSHKITNSLTADSLTVVKAIQIVFSVLPVGSMRYRFIYIVVFGTIVSLIDIVVVSLMATLATVLSSANKVGIGPLENVLTKISPTILDLSSADLIMSVAIATTAAIAIKNIARAIFDYQANYYYTLIDGEVGKQLLTNIVNKPYTWHVGQNSSDLLLAISWRSYFGSVAVASFMNLTVEAIFVFMMLVALIVVSPLVSGLAVIVVGLAALLAYRWSRKAIDNHAGLQRLYKVKIGRLATTTIHGIRDVKTFGKSCELIDDFESNALLQAQNKAKLNMFLRIPSQILEVVGIWSLVLAIGILLYITPVTQPVLIMTIALLGTAAWRVLPALSKLLSSFVLLRNALPYLERVLQYIEPKKADAVSPHQIESANIGPEFQTISFEGVGFHYPTGEQPALNDFCLKIQKDEAIGIVGPSGAGKSTFVDLLVGLLVPTHGAITLDAQVLNQDNVDEWRKRVGYVPQTPYIADASLAENIAFGCSTDQIDSSRVLKCCEMAAIDFLETLPSGINTPIGERGVLLSGGQRQRVAIARALYNDPEILIFDEATSALDAKLEEDIRKTIYEFKGQMTLVIIAHRLSTVEDCDRVVWIEKGRVRSSGIPCVVLANMHNADDDNRIKSR